MRTSNVQRRSHQKVINEIVRIVRQVLNVPSTLFDHVLARFYYDLILASKIKTVKGSVVLSEKCAIYLVFPDPFLSQGHLTSIKYLLSEGYAPVVVSNAPLSQAELDLIRPFAHQILIRPNFGYDFGGYRDGILAVYPERNRIRRLAIFNDSCWFPLPDSKSWLAAAEAMNVDFAGALAHADMDWLDVLVDPTISDKRLKRHKKLFHYCSFALLFSRGALEKDIFWQFWRRLRISSSKHRTIRYGERALSNFMFKTGFSHAVSTSQEDIAQSLKALPEAQKTTEVRLFLQQGGWPAYALREHLWTTFHLMFLKKRFQGALMTTQRSDLSGVIAEQSKPLCGS
ncbi:MAG: rhamnan synthesis F family protein [Pseudomonadota bacterium]